jgi:4-phytase/acid phosphatase
MKRLLLAICVAFAPAAQAATLHTVRVVLLMRHGVRPPTHEPALDPAIAPDPWPKWDVPDGDLTPHGAAAISLLASFDRAMLAGEGLMPAAGCPAAGTVSIYADVDERTVKTGEAYAAGFAPGCALPVGHAAGAKDPLFSALDTPSPDFDAKAAKKAMEEAAGFDIKNPAGAYPALFQAMEAALDPGGHGFLDLPSKLSAKSPGAPPKLSGPLAEGSSASEDFLLEYLEGKPMAQVGWGRVDAAQVATLLAFHPLAYTVTARPPYIADRAAGPLGARVLAGLTAGPTVTVLVGHDTNLAELGGMLDLHWSLGGYPADDPPPGGGIIFSLLRDSLGISYVTAAYQVQTMGQIRNLSALNLTHPPAIQPLAIPGCGNSVAQTACKLADFTSLIHKAAAQ